MPDQRDPDPVMRRAQRVLLMVHELHKLGYQRLRAVPGEADSGCYWRCAVTPVDNVLESHGAMYVRFDDENAAKYTSADENAYFGWKDARHDTARQLAKKFLERFPRIAARGEGLDYAYAGWYVQMLGFAERGALPVAYANWCGPEDGQRWLPTLEGIESGLPMPPPGEARPG
ncbi:MAG TPA: hypothetical protein VHF22_03275 [Planctomycetota bacterium]|nr:hypothetical protein [Planctomycetota bacterium]